MPLRVGIVGLGKFGIAHLQAWKHLEYQLSIEVAGVYDHNPEKTRKASIQYGVKPCEDFVELLSTCEAIDIVTPTNTHYEYAMKAIKAGKHVFIEKPLTASLPQAEKLAAAAQKTAVKAQVGYIERFNPAFIVLSRLMENMSVYYISASRESPFSPRGTDVSVVLDLMSHDIDLTLCLVREVAVSNVSASGMTVFSSQIDIAEARIEFTSGTVASLRASRAGVSRHRRLTVFTEAGALSADLLTCTLTVYCKPHSPLHQKVHNYLKQKHQKATAIKSTRYQFTVYRIYPEKTNALADELKSFALAVMERQRETSVPLAQALKTLQLASQISERIEVFAMRAQSHLSQ